MPLTTSLPLSRQWFTWSDRPAEMCFQPLGLKITPVLYSTRLRKTSLIEPRIETVRLGRHRLDGGLAEVSTTFAGTEIGFQAGTTDPFTLRGGWRAGPPAEWGARFWVVLAVHAPEAELQSRDGAILVRTGQRWTAVVTRDPAIVISGHDSVQALREDLEANGYFNLASRAERAPVLALRFNLDMMQSGGWAAAVADAPELALARARAALAGEIPQTAPLQLGQAEGALDALRDIVGWNTVWDEENGRAYTKVTRIWNLGRFAVWYNDQCYAALMAGVLDTDLARENMVVAHGGATPQGNVACIVTSNDAWIDRSQPPLGALIAWMLYQRSGERSLLTAQYDTLLRNQRWWRTARDPQASGLMSCGSSDVGSALYKGTHFGARNETGMDNSATHDEAVWQEESRSLSTWDLGLNCAIALDAEMLGRIAAELGEAETAAEMAGLAARHRALISEKLWDPERRIFANRQRDGGFVRALSPTSFYPLLCGAAEPEQVADLLAHLEDPASFKAPYPLPNATRDDPAYGDNVYWRGRIWPNVNYLVWLGLHRAGETARAARLAQESHALFRKTWDRDRTAGENFNAETGEVHDQGDADGFYIWAGLLPLMAVEEICGFSPWEGWVLRNGPDVELGPLQSPLGPVRVTRSGGEIRLASGGRDVLVTDHAGSLSHLRFGPGMVSCRLTGGAGDSRLSLPQVPAERVVAVHLDAKPCDFESQGQGISVCVQTSGDSTRSLTIWYAEMPADRHEA